VRDGDAVHARDNDGMLVYYRMLSSCLERRAHTSRLWLPVSGDDFLRMNAKQLKVIASILGDADE